MAEAQQDEGTQGADHEATHRVWLWWALGGTLVVVIVLLVALTRGSDDRKDVRAGGSSGGGAGRSETANRKPGAATTTTTVAGPAADEGASATGPGSGIPAGGTAVAGGGGGAPASGGAPAPGPPPDTAGPNINASINPDVIFVSGCNTQPNQSQMLFTASDPSGLASYRLFGVTYPLSGQTSFSGGVTVTSPNPVSGAVMNVTATDTRGNSSTVGAYYYVDPCP